jgi:hypothetical protein
LTASNTSTNVAIAQSGLRFITSASSWTTGTTHTLYGDDSGANTKYIQWKYDNNPGTTIADGANINLSTPYVGINCNAPGYVLDVHGSTNVSTMLYVPMICNVSNIYGPGSTLTMSNSTDLTILAGSNLYMGSPSGNYNGIYSGSGYVQVDPSQNVNIGAGTFINHNGVTIFNHPGTYASGLGLQVTNVASGGTDVTPSSYYGTIFVTANSAGAATITGNSMVLEVGGYGGNIFGGIYQGNYGFLALGTNNGTYSYTERLRIAGDTGFVGIATTTATTTLDVGGGLTVRNGIRPLFSNVSGSSITTDPYSYGTYYYLVGTLSTITVGVPVSVGDSNAYWLFRNATSSYQSIVVTWPTISGIAPSPSTDTFTIPPLNSMSIMYTPFSGDYGNYSGDYHWAIF